jgi:hypothetical protein
MYVKNNIFISTSLLFLHVRLYIYLSILYLEYIMFL